MDIFTLDKTTYTNGPIINGIETVTWVERYSQAGEFTITGEPSLMALLPVASLISHTGTLDVMMVEQHLVEKNADGVYKLKISGRSADVVAMENRVLTSTWFNRPGTAGFHFGVAWGAAGLASDFSLLYLIWNYAASLYTWDQLVVMLTKTLQTSSVSLLEDYPNLRIRSTVPDPGTGIVFAHSFSRLETVWSAAQKQLAEFDGGIRVERPNGAVTTLDFIVHIGADLTSTVQFNWASGDLNDARYMWDYTPVKNAAYVSCMNKGSSNFDLQYNPNAKSGWDLRIMGNIWDEFNLDASSDPSTSATGAWTGTFQALIDASRPIMITHAKEIVAQRAYNVILDAVVSPDTKYVYGVDYKMGDKVYVVGDFGVSSAMRVVEYAFTSDENGDSGFPTLSALL